MKSKTINISYWVVTGIFALFMLFSGISELILTEAGKEVMRQLRYPIYLSTILGVAKIIGVIILLQPWFTTIKEWAYAGFSIDFIGAASSSAFSGLGSSMIISPLVILGLMFLSYYLWKKRRTSGVIER